MADALRLRLEAYVRLSHDEHALLARLASKHVRQSEARRDVVREGETPRALVVLAGWACRYKQLPDGRRQIVSMLIPGDICDADAFALTEVDCSIGAITRLRYAEIAAADVEEMMLSSPRIVQALQWHEMVAAATQREWTLNVGRRTASERVAHLLCELFVRLRAVGETRDGRCDFPLTQNDLADATGLTPVHINRTLQDLRRDGLITLERRTLAIPDLDRLMDRGLFTSAYLHLDHEGRHLDAND